MNLSYEDPNFDDILAIWQGEKKSSQFFKQ